MWSSGSPTVTKLVISALLIGTVAGCGSDEETGATSTSSEAGGVVVAALGDSITSGSPGYDPGAANRGAGGLGDDERSQYEYWAERAAPGLRFRNCGVLGQRTDEIARRLETCTKGADAVIVQGGINDIAQGSPA